MADDSVLDQSDFRVRFGWGERELALLAPLSARVVVVDVLRFTTAVTVAVERGAAVYPYRWRDESAAGFARQVGAELAGGWVKDAPSLSPVSLQRLGAGDRLVLPSPNGATLTLMAAELGAGVFAGSLRNASAVAAECAADEVVTVIAAGERWSDGTLRACAEDLLGAGAVLAGLPADERSPEAQVAVAAFEEARPQLETRLRQCSSGRELLAKGFGDDVTMAAQLDVASVCPVLADGVYVAAASER